jgi:hypothetical protein
MRPAVAILAAGSLALAASGCAARRLAPPAGPRVPAPDGAAIWAAAAEACRAVRVYSSTIRLGGRVAGDRIPAGLAIASGLEAGGRLRLEARMLGRLFYTMAGAPDRAVLLLHREREYVADRPDQILERMLGARLAPGDLLAILTGCVTFDRDLVAASRFGEWLEIETAGARIYLRSAGARWQPRLAFTANVQVDFTAFDGLWPREIRVWTAPGADPAAELRLRIDSVHVNDFTLPEDAFTVDIPAGATPIALDALRQAVNGKGLDR